MAVAPALIALTVVGGVVQAVGTMQAAQATTAAANYNAAVNDRNSRIAIEQGEADAERQRRQNQINLGRLTAAYGDAGLGFQGDALSIFADAATQGELDVATIKYNAKLRSIGYEDQAQLNRMEARSASTAGILGAVDAAIGTGRSILRAA